MNSYQTIDDARHALATHPRQDNIVAIIEIEPGLPGVGRYILSLAPLAELSTALASKPMAEIKRLIRVAADVRAERIAQQRIAVAEREALLARYCPGLDELREAIADEARYQTEFSKMMEDENNDGARPPRPIKVTAAEVVKRYPAAAAYIKAESYSYAEHYAKSGAGRRAMERLEAGEDYKVVIAEMEAEWSKAAEESVANS